MNDSISSSFDTLLRQVSSSACSDEAACLEELLPHLLPFKEQQALILARALHYVEIVRAAKPKMGVENFLQEYGLNSREGLALLRLAEALLRIPDGKTADALIEGSMEGSRWLHPGGAPSGSLMHSAGLGLNVAQRILQMGTGGGLIAKLLGKAGDPLIRVALKRAMRVIGTAFIIGETMPQALKNAAPYMRKGYLFSYDMLGEGARSQAQADGYLRHYLEAIKAIGKHNDVSQPLYRRAGVSIKLSALHPRFELLKYNRLMAELLPSLITLADEAEKQGVMLTIDAEEASRLDITLALFAALLKAHSFEGLGIAVQAYQKRAMPVLKFLRHLAEGTGHRIPVRLVKGAYWDAEIKRAQMLGLEGFPVFTRKAHTDVSYMACAAYLLEQPDYFYPQFATHNALTVASIEHIAAGKEYEFQRLQGMGEQLYDALLLETSNPVPCRIYAPVGPHEELLAYLIRRLLENGAANSFVHQLSDHSIPLESVLADPINAMLLEGMRPARHIALPEQLYGDERKNAAGKDTGYRYDMYALHSQLNALQESVWLASPLVAGEAAAGKVVANYQPSSHKKKVGEVTLSTPAQCEVAMVVAQAAFAKWSGVPVEFRAAMLEKLGELLEENTVELIALLMREGGKALADSIAEIKEAVDFCRYYAAEARKVMQEERLMGPVGEENTLSLHPRGVFVCISPWNFPLAIFIGQIAAALVTGNTVVAKPAGQTPLIAFRAVSFMHEAGIPKEVVQLVTGEGAVAGAALVGDVRTAGVAFTGSTAVARAINRILSQREAPIVPLIAETGGQNCMIVDSSALLEQAVDDIVTSAFNSAGQRCSALRVLYVQTEVADRLIELLMGAMAELEIGEPTFFSADIGPVIDAGALEALEAHVVRMKREAKLLYAPALSPSLKEVGYFIAPHLFEVSSIASLQGEVFGPILHLIRYKSEELGKVIHDINSTGYGLTLGICSRIEERVQFVASHARVGNIYVNRSMIGATVGVQPFGGEGLSGTGPKAGGPHYLARFCTERVISVNTAAIGGNVALFDPLP